jgi:outer membrane protein assembly factor BamB
MGALATLALSATLAATTPQAKQVYTTVWQTDIAPRGPCLLTLFLPPSDAERCIPWTRRETAGAAFHRPTGIVIVGGADGVLHGISARDGSSFYRASIPGALVSRPVIDGASTFFGTDEAHVVRADVTSGRVRWDVEVDAEVTEPVVVHGETVLVVTGLDSVYAFDRDTGNAKWVHKHPLPPGITLRGQARPLVVSVKNGDQVEDRVVVGHATGRLSVLSLGTGQVLGEYTIGQGEGFLDVDADPVYQRGRVVAASHAGPVMALDPLTGTESWRVEEAGITRLARAGRFLVIAAGPGKAVAIDTRVGQVVWRFTFKRGAPTRIVVKGGRVHFASDLGSLYILDAYSGEPLQYFGSGLGFASDLSLVDDMLFAVSAAGRLFALSNGTTTRFVP